MTGGTYQGHPSRADPTLGRRHASHLRGGPGTHNSGPDRNTTRAIFPDSIDWGQTVVPCDTENIRSDTLRNYLRQRAVIKAGQTCVRFRGACVSGFAQLL